jgi:hypothetical protein
MRRPCARCGQPLTDAALAVDVAGELVCSFCATDDELLTAWPLVWPIEVDL